MKEARDNYLYKAAKDYTKKAAGNCVSSRSYHHFRWIVNWQYRPTGDHGAVFYRSRKQALGFEAQWNRTGLSLMVYAHICRKCAANVSTRPNPWFFTNIFPKQTLNSYKECDDTIIPRIRDLYANIKNSGLIVNWQ